MPRLQTAPVFDGPFRETLRSLMRWRRDVRRFRPTPVTKDMLDGLIAAAELAPSVGLSQPWRFVVVDDLGRRRRVIEDFERCNAAALADYDQALAFRYAALKLAGLRDAPRHLAVFCDEESGVGHGLGRQTMPETARYSVVAAICNLWMAARAEGLGVGWVSILEPDRITEALEAPAHWRLVAYLCIGYPETDDDTPELERQGWERRSAGTLRILQR